MATATPIVPRGTSSPPTEAEIRAAIEQELERHPSSDADAGPLIHSLTYPVVDMWTDLRPSEKERLENLIEPIYQLADEFEARVIAAAVVAGLQFASEHPDAPRAKAGQPA